MDNAHDFVEATPTGRSIIVGSSIRRDNVKKNVKTSQQASADANEKNNKNEYVCNNIELNKEDFSNCKVRYNEHSIFFYIIGSVLCIICLYFAYKSIFK